MPTHADRLRATIRELRDQWQALKGEDVNREEEPGRGVARAVARLSTFEPRLGSSRWMP